MLQCTGRKYHNKIEQIKSYSSFFNMCTCRKYTDKEKRKKKEKSRKCLEAVVRKKNGAKGKFTDSWEN